MATTTTTYASTTPNAGGGAGAEYELYPATLAGCNATLTRVRSALQTCGCDEDGTQTECTSNASSDYDRGLHVAAVFIILVVSSLGAVLPLLLRRVRSIARDGYVIMLGKHVGTGIVLACALIHMLQPASSSLTNICVPTEFTEDYPAYAFLFAMLAALIMHLFETLLRIAFEPSDSGSGAPARTSSTGGGSHPSNEGDAPVDKADAQRAPSNTAIPDGDPEALEDDPARKPARVAGDEGHSHSHSHSHSHGHTPAHAPSSDPLSDLLDPVPPTSSHSSHREIHVPHEATIRHAVHSYTMEIALTVHSVFVGLTVGVVGYQELVSLLAALCFHQFFEGVALGARLADAQLASKQSFVFVLIFAVAAPVGIACGILFQSQVNPAGVTYLLVEGVFDGLCAGLLLYVGFQLLLVDFPEDMRRFTDKHDRRVARRVGMFLALWVGAGVMALVGRYL